MIKNGLLKASSLAHAAIVRGSAVLVTLVCLATAASAQTPQYSFVGGTSSNSFPLNITTNNKVQWVFIPSTHFPTAPSGLITKVYFRNSSAITTSTFTNLTVKLGPSTVTSFSGTAQPWVTGLTTVYTATTTTFTSIPIDGWFSVTLPTPYLFDASQNLIVELSQTAYTGGVSLRQDAAGGNSRQWGNVGSATTTSSGTGRVNFGFDLQPANPCAGTPTAANITTASPATPVCSGTTFTLSATDPNQPVANVTYQWQQSSTGAAPWTNVTGGTGGTTLNYTTAALAATTWYRLNITCTNSAQTTSSAAVQVQVNAPSIASTSPGSRCGLGPVALAAVASSGGTEVWYAAATGGTPLFVGTPFITPNISANTTYYVASASGSCTSARTPVVATVNAIPSSAITFGGSPAFCLGQTVTMNAPTGTNFSYQWFGNGSAIAGATSSSYTTGSPAGYTVTVTNTATACSSTTQQPAVTQLSTPPAVISPLGQVSVCPGASTTFSTASFPGLTYQWRRNGNPIAGATSATYSASLAGSYTVTVSNGPSCTNTTPSATLLSNYTSPPAAISTPSGTIQCVGTPLTLVANADTGVTYQWRLGNTNISGATAATYGATAGGNYTVRVTRTSTGCTTLSPVVAVVQRPVPTATATLVGPSAACDSVRLQANSGNLLSYQWRLGGTPVAGATAGTFSARTSGSYSVRITDSNGCAANSPAVAVTVYPEPPAYIGYNSPLEFCEGSGVALLAPPVPGNQTTFYEWLRDTTLAQSTTLGYYVAMQSGQYRLKVTNSFGCTAISDPVSVTVNPTPQPTINVFGPTLSTGAFASYQWKESGVPIPGANSATYTATQLGSYSVMVADAAGCVGESPRLYLGSLSVGSAAAGAQVRIFPNPATDMLYIEAPAGPVSVRMLDATGRTVLQLSAARQVDVSRLAPGVYSVTVADEAGRVLATERVVKTR